MNRRNFIAGSTLLGTMSVLINKPLLASGDGADGQSIPIGIIKGVHHVGLSVANLDRSLAFYRDMLGVALLGEGRFQGEAYENITGLKGASGRMAMLRVGNLHIEMFEYEHPRGSKKDLMHPVADLGFNHLCFEVEDVHKEYKRLIHAGVTFHCSPQLFGKAKATYGRDPDGNVFELVEW